jgi:hypothetical protein
MATFIVSADLFSFPEAEDCDPVIESSYISTRLTAEDERCFAEWDMKEIYDRFRGLYCWEDGVGRLICEESDSWIVGSVGRSITSDPDPDKLCSATFTVSCDDISKPSWDRFVRLMKKR